MYYFRYYKISNKNNNLRYNIKVNYNILIQTSKSKISKENSHLFIDTLRIAKSVDLVIK